MAYIDLNTTPVSFTKEDFDFVIIGSGVAGILLAVKLQEKGKRVLMLESGHFDEDDKRQVLNEVEQTGKVLTSAVWGRKRAVGGTTIAWGGQSLHFSKLDFEKRDWVANSGWPITYDDIKEHYPIANRFMGIDEYDYEGDIFRMLKMKPQPFDEALIKYHFSKWAPEPNFKKLYEKQLSSDITVIYNAVVAKINLDTDNKAQSLSVRNFNQQEYIIPVQQVLLATGSIEASRLLLTSNDKDENGIGNHSGWLGKCFMDHPCIEVGAVKSNNMYALQSAFNTHMYKKRKYSIRMSLSREAQIKYKLMNCSAGIMFDYPGDSFDPYIEIRKYLKDKNVSSLAGFFKNIPAYTLSAKALLFDKLIYKHKARAKLVMMLEQEPLIESNIKLGNDKDVVGMPKAIMNWEISSKTWHTVIKTAEFVKSELKRLGMGDLQIHEHVYEGNTKWLEYLSDVNHQMGGTRMSDKPEEGVVDTNLQVWGHDNIYVAACSVFPTTSHSNPTLTLMALCLRLVDRLTK